MKSFVLSIPKSPSNIIDHYFCQCGVRFENRSSCPQCGNEHFFTYDDVKNDNPKLFEFQEMKFGLECFIEYPMVAGGGVKIAKKRIAIMIADEIKLNQKYREDAYLYDEEIAEIVKKYLQYLGLWNERKRIWKLLKEYWPERLVKLAGSRDPEVLLWYRYEEGLSRDEYFQKLLDGRPKSVKKVIFEKYKKLLYSLRYDPFIDILILRSIDDVNLQRELIELSCESAEFIQCGLDELERFIGFLRSFDHKERVRFLKKSMYEDMLETYINKFIKNGIHKKLKRIDETILFNPKEVITYRNDMQTIYRYEGFTFRLPKDSMELREYAYRLRNCLDMYADMHNERYLIFGVFRGDKLKYAINYDRLTKSIKEAKGFANAAVEPEVMEKFERFFASKFCGVDSLDRESVQVEALSR